MIIKTIDQKAHCTEEEHHVEELDVHPDILVTQGTGKNKKQTAIELKKAAKGHLVDCSIKQFLKYVGAYDYTGILTFYDLPGVALHLGNNTYTAKEFMQALKNYYNQKTKEMEQEKNKLKRALVTQPEFCDKVKATNTFLAYRLSYRNLSKFSFGRKKIQVIVGEKAFNIFKKEQKPKADKVLFFVGDKGIEQLARQYKVSIPTIYRRGKYPYQTNNIPIELKNKIRKKIKEGYSKAETAQMYDTSVFTIHGFTKDLHGYKYNGDYIIRKHGIELLGRLLRDGYLISDFIINTVRGLQKHFPMIRTARYNGKTFFYLEGRENETIEAFLRERPERIINYSTLEELSYLLGVELSKKNKKELFNKLRTGHHEYLRSIRQIQLKIDDFSN